MDNESPDKPPRRKGGRPPKADEERRQFPVTSVYTEKEKARLVALAASAGCAVSICQREAALNGKVIALDKDAGLRLAVLHRAVSQLRYCRVELNKIERHLAGRSDHQKTAQTLTRVDELMLVVTLALRKEIGLDPG